MSTSVHRGQRCKVLMALKLQAIVSCQYGFCDLNTGPLYEDYMVLSHLSSPDYFH